jgi:hypothetical protein
MVTGLPAPPPAQSAPLVPTRTPSTPTSPGASVDVGVTLAGTMLVYADFQTDGDACVGTRQYADVREGFQLTIEGPERSVLGTAQLRPGVTDRVAGACAFAFSFTDLRVVGRYFVVAGNRGELEFTHADLVAADWTIELELGKQ